MAKPWCPDAGDSEGARLGEGSMGSYLKGIWSVASSPPLAGPDEGSILEFFELISVLAETAHFQLPTPRG